MHSNSMTLAKSYVHAVNHQEADAFLGLFSESAIVNDAGREIQGREAIEQWRDREIFDVQVNLEVLDMVQQDGKAVVTTKVDGTFDRTGLPDPLIIVHRITSDGEKITGLTCSLAG